VVPWRFLGERGGGESIETTTRSFPDWFSPRLRWFSGREDHLPVDANLLLALVAPGAALIQWGTTDQVVSGWAAEQAVRSAQTVYELFGKTDRISLLRVPGFHGSNDQQACIDFLDCVFERSHQQWHYEPTYPYSFEGWEKISGEKLNNDIIKKTEKKLPKKMDTKFWEKEIKPEIMRIVNYFSGEKPPLYVPNAADNVFRGRGTVEIPSPTLLAQGTTGNPGQLQPDVPAWVLAQSGNSYGFPIKERDNLDSKRFYFGEGVRGDFYFPKNTPEGTKLKTVIFLHGFHYPLGYMWVYRSDLHPVLALVNAGYAVLAFDQSGFGMRTDEDAPFYNRFPHWSRMGKMVEDVSAAVDALQQNPMVDTAHISIFGHTLGATVALYAAASDQRIEGVVAVSGFTPMRTDSPARGTSGMTRYSHLYGLIPRLGLFKGKEQTLPYDFNDLLQMIMPRKALVVQPLRDRDADPDAVRKAVKSVPGTTLHEPDDYGRLTNSTQDKAIDWLINNFPL